MYVYMYIYICVCIYLHIYICTPRVALHRSFCTPQRHHQLSRRKRLERAVRVGKGVSVSSERFASGKDTHIYVYRNKDYIYIAHPASLRTAASASSNAITNFAAVRIHIYVSIHKANIYSAPCITPNRSRSVFQCHSIGLTLNPYIKLIYIAHPASHRIAASASSSAIRFFAAESAASERFA